MGRKGLLAAGPAIPLAGQRPAAADAPQETGFQVATGDRKGFDLDHGGFAAAGRPVAGPGFAETVRIRALAQRGARRANYKLQASGDTAHGHPARGASVAGGYRGHRDAGAAGLRATAAGLDRVMQGLLAAVADGPGAP